MDKNRLEASEGPQVSSNLKDLDCLTPENAPLEDKGNFQDCLAPQGFSREGKPIQFYLNIPLYGGRSQIVAAYKHDELSDWCWHGTDRGKPFWSTSRRRRAWHVAHIRTGMSIGSNIVRLDFPLAADLSAELDRSVEGGSQIALSDIGETVAERTLGWRGEPMKQAAYALNRFCARHGMREPFPSPSVPEESV